MLETATSSQFVSAVFSAWREQAVNFLVLRNYEQLPEFTTNDIDVLVEGAQLAKAEKVLLATAGNCGFQLHNRAEFATLALYFCNLESGVQTHFDLFTALKWRSFDFLFCDGFLSRKRERGSFFIPHPSDEAATNLLANLIYTGKVKEKYKASIIAGFRSDYDQSVCLLARTYGRKQAKLIARAAGEGDWNSLEKSTGSLRGSLVLKELTRHPSLMLASFYIDAQRIVKRLLHPPGISVVLCGTDGSGKSTAALNLVDNLGATFSPVKGRRFHWKIPLFSGKRIASRKPTSNPHDRPPRSVLASILFFGFHWLEFFLASRLLLRPLTFRGGLVLIDRYYYDFFVDQTRYRMRVPNAWVRLGFAFIKKPDLVLLLDAPTEILRSRKQEMPQGETERQRNEFLNLVRGLPNGRVIDAAKSPGEVAIEIRKVLLEFMVRRAATRLKVSNRTMSPTVTSVESPPTHPKNISYP